MASSLSSSPYDVLSPVTVDSSDVDTNTTDTDIDTGAEDSSADDSSTDDTAEETTDGSEEAEASDEDSSSAEEGDPAKTAEQAAAAKAEDAQWKAKDGNIPSALKEIMNANPAAAKRLKEMYFTNQRLTKFGPAGELKKMKEAVDAVGGSDKLIELKNQIDMMGGEAGFQESQQELQSWRELDNKWQNDANGCADHLFGANGAAAERLAPVMFNKIADTNPELYDNLASQLIINTFAQSGTLTSLQLMGQALQAGNAQLAGEYYQKVAGVLGSLNKLAQQAPKMKTADPKEQAWQAEKKTYEQKIQETFQGELQTANQSWMNPKITTNLASYLNGAEKKLSPNTVSRIDRAVKEEIWNNHLSSNPTFVKQREALLAKRDKDGLVRLYKQYAPDKLWQKVTRDICAEFSLQPSSKKGAAAAPAAAGAGKPNAKAEVGWTKTTKMPKVDEVDRTKTSRDMIIKDQYILKDGRKVQVI